MTFWKKGDLLPAAIVNVLIILCLFCGQWLIVKKNKRERNY